MVNGFTYKCFRSTGPSGSRRASLYRDSLGYVVDEKGIVHFSPINFMDTFYRPIVAGGYDTFMMEKGMMKVIDKPM